MATRLPRDEGAHIRGVFGVHESGSGWVLRTWSPPGSGPFVQENETAVGNLGRGVQARQLGHYRLGETEVKVWPLRGYFFEQF